MQKSYVFLCLTKGHLRSCRRKALLLPAEANREGRDRILKNSEFSRGHPSPTLQVLNALTKWEGSKLSQSIKFLQGLQAFARRSHIQCK